LIKGHSFIEKGAANSKGKSEEGKNVGAKTNKRCA